MPVDELVERLWGEDPPFSPRGALQTCVTRLRGTLHRHGHGGTAEPVRRTAAGYLIESDARGLDLIRFRDLTGRARTAAGRGDTLAEEAGLSAALALWRGPALTDVRSDSLHRDAVPKLTEERLRAAVRLAELRIGLGRHDEQIGELRSLLRRDPFHERLWLLLMLALHRGGRRAEALAAFNEVSARLRDELGLDPGPELSRLRLAMLRDDPLPEPLRDST